MSDTPEKIDWKEATETTFGEGSIEKTPWIKLNDDESFVGVLTMVKPGMERTDYSGKLVKYTEIWFDDEGMERHLDASLALMRQFTQANPQIGDTVKISRNRELATDKEGNPVMANDPESGNEVQQSFTRYKIEIVKGEKKAAKKVAEPAVKTDEGDINLDDLPF